MTEIEAVPGEAGIETVDGSISGPPPHEPGTTRIYLAGPRAAELAALPFEGVERVVVGGRVGLASAVKTCTASVYAELSERAVADAPELVSDDIALDAVLRRLATPRADP